MKKLIVISLIVFAALVMLPAVYAEARQEQQPEQPNTPIVDNGFKHNAVAMFHYNKGKDEFWIFEPDEPKPDKAPVVVFNHGWSAMTPGNYGAWIDHIVKRRNIVIFPRYQGGLLTLPKDFTHNAIESVKNAISILQTGAGHVTPDLSKFAVVGHSAGGIISANMAALASERGIPTPGAVMCVFPGVTWKKRASKNIPLEGLRGIHRDTLLLSVAGDRDWVVEDIDAKKIFMGSVTIPAQNKNYILLRSDNLGWPPLVADHFAASSPVSNYDSISNINGKIKTIRYNGFTKVFSGRRVVDAMDYYGLWKLFDGLTDAAFYGKNREYGLDNTDKQRFMGIWSDGTPVKELNSSNYNLK